MGFKFKWLADCVWVQKYTLILKISVSYTSSCIVIVFKNAQYPVFSGNINVKELEIHNHNC